MNALKINISVIVPYLAGLCIYASANPYYFWNSKLILIPRFILVIICLYYIKQTRITITKKVFNILFFILYLWYSIKGGYTLYGTIANLCIPLLFVVDKPWNIKILETFKNVLAVILSLSILSYIIVVFLSINLPHTDVLPLNTIKPYTYLAYPFLVIPNVISYSPIIRFCAEFEEPGNVGTLCGIILFFSHFNFRNKANIVFFAAGLLSLSLFFYLMCFIYLALFSPLKYKLLVLMLFVLFSGYILSDSTPSHLILDRLTIENGWISGDNRTYEFFDRFYESFKESSDYYWGVGRSAATYFDGSYSYKMVIATHGLFFFILFLAAFFIRAKKLLGNNLNLILYILVFVLTIYQRPSFGDLSMMFILYSGVCLISEKSGMI